MKMFKRGCKAITIVGLSAVAVGEVICILASLLYLCLSSFGIYLDWLPNLGAEVFVFVFKRALFPIAVFGTIWFVLWAEEENKE